MDASISELRTRLAEIDDLRSAAALLDWDQSTYMPPGGAAARGRQMATLQRIAHEKFIDPAVGELLEKLRAYEDSVPPESDDASLVRVTRRDYVKAAKVPASFAARLSDHCSNSYNAWTKARANDDFAAIRPYLEKTLDLSRELAGFHGGGKHIADPLIDANDEGLDVETVRALFASLRPAIVGMVEAISARPVPDHSFLNRLFPEAAQLEFGSGVIKRLGYDFERGRQDRTHHPFMAKFALGDVRITTRVRQDDLGEALFSTIHEAGHALYEQGLRTEFESTPLANGASAGVHESQSRLWENVVGRSRGFWKYFHPAIVHAFPQQLEGVTLDQFYRGINTVERSLIRTDADEVTYNLHVMIRFDLELQLLEGSLAVRDLPEAWRERYRSDLGVAPVDDRNGAMQDVHWFAGTIGGVFQGYTIGNVLAAQFFEAAVRAQPGIPGEIERGEFGTLRTWLRTHVHEHGRKFLPPELVQRATGAPMNPAPYLNYLRTKYGELYSL